MDNNREVREAALRYAARGWAVFPLWGIAGDGTCSCGLSDCKDAGKHPRARKGVKEATRDAAVVSDWFAPEAPVSNVAIATGEQSGITVLDIDIGLGKVGDTTWAELNKEHGEPQTLTALTGGGGVHVFFAYASSLNTSSNTLGPGVDCRNDGGYVVAAPSRHRSGRAYAWVDEAEALRPLPKHLSTKRTQRGRPRGDDPTRKKYAIEQVSSMLEKIPADDRDLWRAVGIIMGREFNRSDPAWEAYCTWSDSWSGKKGPKHDTIMRECFYELSQQAKGGDGAELSIATIVRKAIDGGWAPVTGQMKSDSFLYYAPGNNFIYRSTNAFWPAESVDACCSMINENGTLMKPSSWLKQKRAVTSMTSDPAITNEISVGFDSVDGALLEHEGSALYNAYRPARIKLGDSRLARPFLEHVFKVFNKPGDADQFLDYMAHRVQKPGEKPRFALLIAGEQGVGKDTCITMCRDAIGAWNIANIDPSAMEQNFNEFYAKVLVVISEAANTNEMNKWAFNEACKVLIAGQPDYIPINPKYGQKYSVRLHNGTIITTNHLATGIYIPAEERRFDVIDSATKIEMGILDPEKRAMYFNDLWRWFEEEYGAQHVAAFLHERDISKFSAATGQRITVAHKMVVATGFAGDDWLYDALDAMEEKRMVRADTLWAAVETSSNGEMTRKEYNLKINHAIDRAGYERLPSNRADGRHEFKKEGVRKTTAVYVKKNTLTAAEVAAMMVKLQEDKEAF